MTPKARQDKLLVQEVGNELVVYDKERHRAHRLNRTAALVWRHCDGQTSTADVATLLHSELNLPADESVVWLALDQLEKTHLLRERITRPADVANISRRQVMRKLGLAGGLALLLPMVTTLIAPTPVLAQSQVTGACGVLTAQGCLQGTCTGTCNPNGAQLGQACTCR